MGEYFANQKGICEIKRTNCSNRKITLEIKRTNFGNKKSFQKSNGQILEIKTIVSEIKQAVKESKQIIILVILL